VTQDIDKILSLEAHLHQEMRILGHRGDVARSKSFAPSFLLSICSKILNQPLAFVPLEAEALVRHNVFRQISREKNFFYFSSFSKKSLILFFLFEKKMSPRLKTCNPELEFRSFRTPTFSHFGQCGISQHSTRKSRAVV